MFYYSNAVLCTHAKETKHSDAAMSDFYRFGFIFKIMQENDPIIKMHCGCILPSV